MEKNGKSIILLLLYVDLSYGEVELLNNYTINILCYMIIHTYCYYKLLIVAEIGTTFTYYKSIVHNHNFL